MNTDLTSVSRSLNILRSREHEFKRIVTEWLTNFNSINTKKSYSMALADFANFYDEFLGLRPVTEINSLEIAKYRDHLKGRKLSNRTINRNIAALSSFFKKLCEENMIKYNPAAGVNRLPVGDNTTIDIRDCDVPKIFNAIDLTAKDGPIHFAILYFAFYTGLRASEICNIKRSDITKVGDDFYLHYVGKGGSPTKKKIPDSVYEVYISLIDHYMKIDFEVSCTDFIFRPVRGRVSNNYSYTPDGLNKLFQKYAKMAGIEEKVTFHSIRSTYIGSALDRGERIIDVMSSVGHKRVQTTFDYAKRRQHRREKSVLSLGY